MTQKRAPSSFLELLEDTVAKSCLCKLRESCDDKSSACCLKNQNIYASAMLNKARKS